MNSDQHTANAVRSAAVVPVPAQIGTAMASRRAPQLHAQAESARRQSRVLAARLRAAQHATAETMQRLQAAWDRAERVRELQLAASAGQLQYSAQARLLARLASMPVIEQAKGIIMAQCGCPPQQAFDALRRASQRENIKVRDLAARVVANTVRSASAQRPARREPASQPGELSRVAGTANLSRFGRHPEGSRTA